MANNYHSPEPDDEISVFLHQILLSDLHQPQMLPPHAQIPIGNLDNELDNYDCESEEGIVEEIGAKARASRSCSKRSRAAEVHNLSEKRRRSKINEKMKALQNLIPNSNKTDKASMLDEAIEYLKQLQLQVQMLTMKNGLSLCPISLPNQMRMDVHDSVDMTKAICMDPNISAPVTHILHSKTSSIQQQQHFGAFQLSGSSKMLIKGICEEELLPCRPLIHSSSGRGACETQITNLKGNVCESGGVHLTFHPH
ncbi:hypothetical protein ACS0TY_029399 [Phlomoides rotata]